ncbi:MAG: sugar ABC transporter permease, partial [Clostridiales Family XIII bacterium]|nr:sugar ABC transporter permease [Clostridiales Family XIII bacterium]
MNKSTIYSRKGPLIVFLAPAFAFLMLFLFYPFVRNIINSFNNIVGLGTPSRGLNSPFFANFVRLFTDTIMQTAFKNTLILMLCTIVFQVGIAIVLALLVDRIKKGAES